jgi:D-alanine-D-alanine ligase
MKKLKIGLIYGGKSGEHQVSLQTALAVMKELDLTRYEVFPFYITTRGEWRTGPQLAVPPSSVDQIAFASGQREPSIKALGSLFVHPAPKEGEIRPEKTARTSSLPAERKPEIPPLDVAFPLLHGTYGEDGTIQGLLEMAQIPYVGAGVLASAVGMDKVMMKKIFAQEGLPQCVYRYFTRNQWEKDQAFFLMEIEIAIGYPCFVKPANLGSSVGISKAHNRGELLKAVALAFQYDRKVIVEENIPAREIEVSVLGNHEPVASVPGEIISSGDFYDYRAKYIDGNTAMIIPADLPDATRSEIQEMAIRAFQAIDASGLSRVDFFLSKEDGRILVNEINTMPGFTPFSMYPLLWKESGKPYGELLDDLIRLAVERYEEKQRIQYTFDQE